MWAVLNETGERNCAAAARSDTPSAVWDIRPMAPARVRC